MEPIKRPTAHNPLKTKFDAFAPEVPPEIWQRIEEQLDEAQPLPLKRSKRRKTVLLLYATGIAATMFIAFTFWHLNTPDTQNEAQNVETYASQNPTKNAENTEEKKSGSRTPTAVTHVEETKVSINHQPQSEMLNSEKSISEELSTVKFNEAQQSLALISTSALSELSIAEQEQLPSPDPIIALQNTPLLQEDIPLPPSEESGNLKNKKLGVSTVLNFLAQSLTNDIRDNIEFSESEEGILKVDLKMRLAKAED